MLTTIVSFFIVFTAVILVHEWGHLIAARMTGVKVYEFSIGFPLSPRLLTLFRHRETVFTLRLLPLGGFVSFSKAGDENDLALFESSLFERAVIFFMGPLFNILFAFLLFTLVFLLGNRIGPWKAMAMSGETVWNIFSGTAQFILELISGNGSAEGLAGPVGIAAVIGRAAESGMLNLCYITGALSMSLGIMNLLPLPALDGGHLAMILFESVSRKRISPRAYQMATAIGLMVFLLLTVVITYKDIASLIS
jgi:regulator of sigma E protease